MRGRNVACVLLLAALASPLSAAPPKVPGKVVAAPGGRAVVEIEAPAPGVKIAWREAFSAEDCFVDELKPLRPDTIRLIVLPVKANVYRVVTWAGLAREDSAEVVIDAMGGTPIPPGPGPVPPPVPLPDGKFGLTKASRDGFAKVATGKESAPALAKAQRAHASATAAGAFGNDAAKILAGWRTANNGVVQAAQWGEWGKAVSAKLAELHGAGKLPTTADWTAAFNEIADGLGG